MTLDFKGRSKRIVGVLGDLASRNDTLFDLSGTHYNITSFIPSSEIMAPKPVDLIDDESKIRATSLDPEEVEALIYMSVGAAIAFLITASLMFAVCQCIAKPKPRKGVSGSASDRQLIRSEDSNGALFSSQYSLEEFPSGRRRANNSQQPKMIYSRSFSNGLSHQHQQQHPHQGRYRQQHHHHHHHHNHNRRCYTPIDDNLAPLASFEEEDFIPKFVHYHDTRSDILPPPPPPRRATVDTSAAEDSLDAAVMAVSAAAAAATAKANRSVHFRPTSAQGYHPPSDSQVRRSRGGCLPMDPVFDATVTVEMLPPPPPMSHPLIMGNGDDDDDDDVLDGIVANGHPMSSFKPPPPSALGVTKGMTQEEIDRDVQIVLHNLGLDNPGSNLANGVNGEPEQGVAGGPEDEKDFNTT